jgi:hypothetical protein
MEVGGSRQNRPSRPVAAKTLPIPVALAPGAGSAGRLAQRKETAPDSLVVHALDISLNNALILGHR